MSGHRGRTWRVVAALLALAAAPVLPYLEPVPEAHLSRGELAASFDDSDRNPPVYDPSDKTVTMNPAFAKSYAAWMDSGMWNLQVPEELGGQKAPASLIWSTAEFVLARDLGFDLVQGFLFRDRARDPSHRAGRRSSHHRLDSGGHVRGSAGGPGRRNGRPYRQARGPAATRQRLAPMDSGAPGPDAIRAGVRVRAVTAPGHIGFCHEKIRIDGLCAGRARPNPPVP